MRIEPVLEDDCARELIGKNLLNKTHGFWVGRLKRLKSVQKLHRIVHFLILTEKPERALLQRSLARYVSEIQEHSESSTFSQLVHFLHAR